MECLKLRVCRGKLSLERLYLGSALAELGVDGLELGDLRCKIRDYAFESRDLVVQRIRVVVET